MKVLFAGIIARYPFGGVTWCSLMYLLGLRALGHEVFYIEDTGECVYDPVQNTRAADADLFINLSGGSWFWRDEYARIPRKVFIDSDPAFTQLAIAKAEPWYVT